MWFELGSFIAVHVIASSSQIKQEGGNFQFPTYQQRLPGVNSKSFRKVRKIKKRRVEGKVNFIIEQEVSSNNLEKRWRQGLSNIVSVYQSMNEVFLLQKVLIPITIQQISYFFLLPLFLSFSNFSILPLIEREPSQSSISCLEEYTKQKLKTLFLQAAYQRPPFCFQLYHLLYGCGNLSG